MDYVDEARKLLDKELSCRQERNDMMHMISGAHVILRRINQRLSNSVPVWLQKELDSLKEQLTYPEKQP